MSAEDEHVGTEPDAGQAPLPSETDEAVAAGGDGEETKQQEQPASDSSEVEAETEAATSQDKEQADGGFEDDDPELEALQQRALAVQERASLVQQESERILQLQKQAEDQTTSALRGAASLGSGAGAAGGSAPLTAQQQRDIDARSVYVGQVDYSATAAELQTHFQSCGTINRVTIVADRYTNMPKGYAYIEFDEEASVQNALALNDTVFRGRQLKVTTKRTNVPAQAFRGMRGAVMPMYPVRGRGVAMAMGMVPVRGRGFGPWRATVRGGRAIRGYSFLPYQ